MTWQGVSETECYDNRSVIAQIVRIKDRLTAVEQNVDPTLREDLTAAIAELEALENTVANVQTAVEGNTEAIAQVQDNVETLDGEVETALTTKADKTQLEDGSVTKVGTADVGGASLPVYLDDGTPTACEDVFLVSTPAHTPGANKDKRLEICNSATNEYPKVVMSISGIDLYGSSSTSYLKLDRSNYKIQSTAVQLKPAFVAMNGTSQTKAHYYTRTVKTSAVDMTKPWMLKLNLSGNPGTAEFLVTTPDGTIKLIITNKGTSSTLPTVQVVTKITGVQIVACSGVNNNSTNCAYVRAPTAYATNQVTATILYSMGWTAEGTANADNGAAADVVGYEDVTHGGITIPNVANYDTNYIWAQVV